MNGVNSLTGDRRLGVVHLVDLAVSYFIERYVNCHVMQ